jgi:hypothetical protein
MRVCRHLPDHKVSCARLSLGAIVTDKVSPIVLKALQNTLHTVLETFLLHFHLSHILSRDNLLHDLSLEASLSYSSLEIRRNCTLTTNEFTFPLSLPLSCLLLNAQRRTEGISSLLWALVHDSKQLSPGFLIDPSIHVARAHLNFRTSRQPQPELG